MKKPLLALVILTSLSPTLAASEPTTGTLIQLSIVYVLPVAVLLSVFWDYTRSLRRRRKGSSKNHL